MCVHFHDVAQFCCCVIVVTKTWKKIIWRNRSSSSALLIAAIVIIFTEVIDSTGNSAILTYQFSRVVKP